MLIVNCYGTSIPKSAGFCYTKNATKHKHIFKYMSLLKDKIELGVQEAEFETGRALGGLPPVVRLLVIVLALGIIPAYYMAKSVSHSSWQTRLSQGKLTAKPSFTNPKAPTTTVITLTTMGTGSYSAALKITNPNLDLSLENVPFQIIFYNAQKQQLYDYSDHLFLLPNQSKYLTAPRFSLSEAPAYADFILANNLPWQKRLSIPQVKFQTARPQLSQQLLPPAFVVEGDFVNNSPYLLKRVRLIFALFDAADKIIGSSQRDEFTVRAFERRGYKQLWPDMSGSNVARVEVAADTDTLDPNNLSASDSPAGSASDLGRPASNP